MCIRDRVGSTAELARLAPSKEVKRIIFPKLISAVQEEGRAPFAKKSMPDFCFSSRDRGMESRAVASPGLLTCAPVLQDIKITQRRRGRIRNG